jgi:group II intron reverse transcriptase/maturase
MKELDVDRDDIIRVVQFAESLAEGGGVSLGTLYRALNSSLDVLQRTPEGNARLFAAEVIELLGWALQRPSVNALSEGPNSLDLDWILQRNGIVWVEFPSQYLDIIEHTLASHLAEMKIAYELARLSEFWSGMPKDWSPMIVRIHPIVSPRLNLELDRTFQTEEVTALHVRASTETTGARRFYLDKSDEKWVTRGPKPLVSKCHEGYLDETAVKAINSMPNDYLMTIKKEAHLSLRVGDSFGEPAMAEIVRRRFRKGRKRLLTAHFNHNTGTHGKGAAIYALLCDKSMLYLGWQQIWATNRKSFGIDGVSATMLHNSLQEELDKLSNELSTLTYKPRPLKAAFIPKEDGTLRRIGVACVRDRIVQAACLQLLEPICDQVFSARSFAFRARKNAHQAIDLAQEIVRKGYRWAVVADIRKCFDNINHKILEDRLRNIVADEKLIGLIMCWMRTDYFDNDEFVPTVIGVPQGAPISPLMTNVYLDSLDKEMDKRGFEYVRYADDMLIFSKNEAEAEKQYHALEEMLSTSHLSIKKAKSYYVNVDTGISFLGFNIKDGKLSVSAKKLDEAKSRLHSIVTELSEPDLSHEKSFEAISDLYAFSRGWRNYFLLENESDILSSMMELDKYTDSLGSDMLPENVLNDGAWINRPRFCPADHLAHINSEILGQVLYPHADTIQSEMGVAREVDGSKISMTTARNEIDSFAKDNAGSDSGIIRDNGIAYVFVNGIYITCGDGNVIIKRKMVVLAKILISELSVLAIFGYGVSLSMDVQMQLAANSVPIICFDGESMTSPS